MLEPDACLDLAWVVSVVVKLCNYTQTQNVPPGIRITLHGITLANALRCATPNAYAAFRLGIHFWLILVDRHGPNVRIPRGIVIPLYHSIMMIGNYTTHNPKILGWYNSLTNHHAKKRFCRWPWPHRPKNPHREPYHLLNPSFLFFFNNP